MDILDKIDKSSLNLCQFVIPSSLHETSFFTKLLALVLYISRFKKTSQRMWRKKNTAPLPVELLAGKVILEICLAEPQKIAFTEDPAIPLLGMYPKYAPTYTKGTCLALFIADFLYVYIIARN